MTIRLTDRAFSPPRYEVNHNNSTSFKERSNPNVWQFFSRIQPLRHPTGFPRQSDISSFIEREFSDLRLRQRPCPGVSRNPQGDFPTAGSEGFIRGLAGFLVLKAQLQLTNTPASWHVRGWVVFCFFFLASGTFCPPAVWIPEGTESPRQASRRVLDLRDVPYPSCRSLVETLDEH